MGCAAGVLTLLRCVPGGGDVRPVSERPIRKEVFRHVAGTLEGHEAVRSGCEMVYGCILLRVQHGSYRHREPIEEHRGRLCPARKNTIVYIGGPCQTEHKNLLGRRV